MATAKKSEVAPTQNDAQLPAGMDLSELMADAGAGVDNLGMDDVAVPYLYILQKGSPQVDEDSEARIPDAKQGMFFNNVTNEIFNGREEGIMVIPCAYERKYVEWIDRDSGGGGYVADHDIDSDILSECTPNEKGIPVLKNGHLIIETAYHYVYMMNPNTGRWEEIIIPMKSTALKKSRRLNKALMATFIPGTASKAPRWLYIYNFKTVKEQRGDNTWSNFEINRTDQMVNKEQYIACKSFAELFEKGGITRAAESGAPTGDGGNTIDGTTNKTNMGDDEEMPF